MRCLRLAVLLPLLALLLGCASDTAESTTAGAGGNYTGGQTGSLMPNCGIAPVSDEGGSVPSGEQAFVLYTRGCPGVPRLDELMISNAAGEPVVVEPEALADGVYLIKGSAVLMEGQYDVTLPTGVSMESASLEVTESAPLPTELGTLSRRDDRQCDVGTILLRPAADLLPYLSLAQFSYSIDGGPSGVAADYGAQAAEDGFVEIPISNCNGGPCVTEGHHRITVSAKIAGETAQPDPATLSFDIRCESDLVTDSSMCAVLSGAGERSGARGGRTWFSMIGLAALFAAVRSRRRTREGA